MLEARRRLEPPIQRNAPQVVAIGVARIDLIGDSGSACPDRGRRRPGEDGTQSGSPRARPQDGYLRLTTWDWVRDAEHEARRYGVCDPRSSEWQPKFSTRACVP